MSLSFKSFIRIRFLRAIFILTFFLFCGIIMYMPKDKNAQAAYILNPDNHDIVELVKSLYSKLCIMSWCKIRRSKRLGVKTARWINASSST